MYEVMWVEQERDFLACLVLPKPGHSSHPSASLWFGGSHEVPRVGKARLDSKSQIRHHILHCSSKQQVNQGMQGGDQRQDSSKTQCESRYSVNQGYY